MPRGRPRSAAPSAQLTLVPGVSAAPGRGARRKPTARFTDKLALNQWMLSLFNVTRFEKLAENLRGEGLRGLDENNVHHFHHALTAHLFNLTQLPTELLLEYDQNIVKHTQRLNERRLTHGQEPIEWQYFQYLALLFTEIYLDRYFSDPQKLLGSINAQIGILNATLAQSDRLAPLDDAEDAWPQLNKLAFWMATGGGKTLVMHANILQYQHYLERHGRTRELNRIILLTPNEGLSQQHLREFALAGIDAEVFSKEGRSLFSGKSVEVIEVTRLREQMGEKTVAVDAFEGNNLVLVDEGHRGASGDAWMRYRNALCEKGFSFEYSATFGQAVKDKPALTDLYAKNILIDYSYAYFYTDGFGKEYQILNLDEGTQKQHQELYLVAGLLSFFQQQRLYRERRGSFRPFNIERPLWVFVGGSVTATLGKQDASDIVEILQFLARYVADRSGSIQRIERVLTTGLTTAAGKNLFEGRFTYLNTCGLSPEQVFQETLATLFNAPGGGQLYIQNLKGATGEIALRIGSENDPFGVINVGDDAKLVKICDEKGLSTGDKEFTRSLFHEINLPHSTVNLLIGSKKFTEGWSSWRVSTMGLMNVGKGEGAQIIQLFGRGVRLQGYGMSLKRSGRLDLPAGVERPPHIGLLETLGIFGVHADYMAQFRDFLEEEGLPANEDRIEFLLPVVQNLGTQRLKTIRLRKTINGVTTDFGDAFRKLAPIPTVAPPDPLREPATVHLQKNPVVVNWYPKIQAMRSSGLIGGNADASPNETHLTAGHTAFLDFDRLYFDLERFKAERSWYNLNLTRDAFEALLADPSWYRLQIPEEELAFGSYDRVRVWQEIALALLKKYIERYYFFRKQAWELPHLEYRELEEDDPNFPSIPEGQEHACHRILIDRSQEEIVAKLGELKALIQSGNLKKWEFRGLKALWFGRHLYEPLLCLEEKSIEIDFSPTPLNKWEYRFVDDLRKFHDGNATFFKARSLYLLRNQSRGRGVGFFEAGNFHPDFILWLLEGDTQRIVFVDPKGIRNLGATDPKIGFHESIKEIEQRLGDPSVRLESFILSNTPAYSMAMLWTTTKDEMRKRHILFMDEDQSTYIRDLLTTVSSDVPVG